MSRAVWGVRSCGVWGDVLYGVWGDVLCGVWGVRSCEGWHEMGFGFGTVFKLKRYALTPQL